MTDRWRKIAQWAALGALSGTLATLATLIPDWLNVENALQRDIRVGGIEFLLSPFTLVPGLAFGLILGQSLRHEGLFSGWRHAAYIAASGLSYFVVVHISINFLLDSLDNIILTGIVAGAIGATLLAAATAALIPDFRRRRPMIAMILAGTILGATLVFIVMLPPFLGRLLLFASWQAGYAAAMATAPGDRDLDETNIASRSGA